MLLVVQMEEWLGCQPEPQPLLPIQLPAEVGQGGQQVTSQALGSLLSTGETQFWASCFSLYLPWLLWNI